MGRSRHAGRLARFGCDSAGALARGSVAKAARVSSADCSARAVTRQDIAVPGGRPCASAWGSDRVEHVEERGAPSGGLLGGRAVEDAADRSSTARSAPAQSAKTRARSWGETGRAADWVATNVASGGDRVVRKAPMDAIM